MHACYSTRTRQHHGGLSTGGQGTLPHDESAARDVASASCDYAVQIAASSHWCVCSRRVLQVNANYAMQGRKRPDDFRGRGELAAAAGL